MSRYLQSKFVMLGIRLIAVMVLAWIVYRDFRAHEPGVWVKDLGLLVIGFALSASSWQGQKLAKQNMRKFGLEPDRDEGPASL